jgi:glycosyltransferase involved in cell wall biosynthesis
MLPERSFNAGIFSCISKEHMTRSIAILHFAAPPIIGGVESTIFHHACLLTDAGYEIAIITGRGEPFNPQIKVQIIPELDSRYPLVLDIGKQLANGKISSQFIQLRDELVQKLRSNLHNIEICIVHNALTLHKNMPLTAALQVLSYQTDMQLIAWCHDFAWQDPIYTLELHAGYPWDLLKTPWPGVCYVAVSEHRRTRLANLFNIPSQDIRVIHPGVNLAQFYKLEPLTQRLIKELDLLHSNPLILLPARITRRKNIQFGIRVMAALKHYFPKVVLVITGPPGPHNPKNIAYLESLYELRNELKVNSSVHFLYEFGEDDQSLYIPDEVIADFYHLADALLFPSRREGFGIPILEAGLARIPIFAADIPTVRESAGEFAYLFDPDDDPEAVAKSISTLLESDQSSQLRQRVLSKFTWEAILKKDLIPLMEEIGSK